MEVATVIFTYNRPYHTEKVLNALKINEDPPSKLIIFQDGLKENTDMNKWEKVGEIVRNIKWCDTEIHISFENKGLAESIISGVTYILKRYDAVIVLEDDCVPHPKFMSYMILALNKYRDKRQVYSVEGGDTWPPINIENKENEDAFFCGRISSLGWGTWRDRWEQYERNYALLRLIKSDAKTREQLEIWGGDLEDQLIGNITGKCDSWAVFWALKVIQKGGYCLRPYESLIKNIGYDGSGVHCGRGKIDIKYRADENMEDFILPDKIQYNEKCSEIYRAFLSNSAIDKLRCYQDILVSWIMIKQKEKATCILGQAIKEPVAIWGRGCLCDLLIQEWEDSKKIEYIIESSPNVQQYHDIPVVMFNELPLNIKTIIVVPIYAMNAIKQIVNNSKRNIDIYGIDELIEEADK